MWKVYTNGEWNGIVETNYTWALAYWSKRGGKLRSM